MTRFIGEYNCKLDAKGRFKLPAGLKKQVSPEADNSFVVNRGFEQCLALYPKNEWEGITKELAKLNLYKKKERAFVRYFHRGASEMSLDSTDRLLLPGRLLEYAGIRKEAVLFAYANRIEIWSPELYDQQMIAEPEDFAQLAEEVMGDRSKENEEDNEVS